METENKKNSIIIVIILLVAILFSIIGWMLGKNYANKESSKEEPKIEEKDNKPKDKESGVGTENESENEPQIDYNSLANQLWDKFDLIKCNEYYLLKDNLTYDSEKMIAKNYLGDFVTDERLEITLASLSPNKTWKESGSICEEFHLSGTCNFSSYSKNEFVNKYKELFGIDKNLEHDTFIYSNLDFECEIKTDEVVCHQVAGGGCFTNRLGETKVTRVEKNDNELIITVNEIKTDEDTLQQIITDYSLTFKKDSTNNWYWYSTEKVN